VTKHYLFVFVTIEECLGTKKLMTKVFPLHDTKRQSVCLIQFNLICFLSNLHKNMHGTVQKIY